MNDEEFVSIIKDIGWALDQLRRVEGFLKTREHEEEELRKQLVSAQEKVKIERANAEAKKAAVEELRGRLRLAMCEEQAQIEGQIAAEQEPDFNSRAREHLPMETLPAGPMEEAEISNRTV